MIDDLVNAEVHNLFKMLNTLEISLVRLLVHAMSMCVVIIFIANS